MRGAVHSQHVFRRHQRLNIVDRIKDETPSRTKCSDPLADLLPNLLGRTERKGGLRVHTPSPESDAVAEFAFQVIGIHAGGGALNGIEHIETRGDEIINQRPNGTATVDEGLPSGISVYPIVDQFVKRKK